jgi:hypothetical protein
MAVFCCLLKDEIRFHYIMLRLTQIYYVQLSLTQYIELLFELL